MASQRWHPGEHESRSCLTKRRYQSGSDAGKAKDAMRRRKHVSPDKNDLNVYRCEYCDGWHLGRPHRVRRPHKRRKRINVD